MSDVISDKPVKRIGVEIVGDGVDLCGGRRRSSKRTHSIGRTNKRRDNSRPLIDISRDDSNLLKMITTRKSVGDRRDHHSHNLLDGITKDSAADERHRDRSKLFLVRSPQTVFNRRNQQSLAIRRSAMVKNGANGVNHGAEGKISCWSCKRVACLKLSVPADVFIAALLDGLSALFDDLSRDS